MNREEPLLKIDKNYTQEYGFPSKNQYRAEICLPEAEEFCCQSNVFNTFFLYQRSQTLPQMGISFTLTRNNATHKSLALDNA